MDSDDKCDNTSGHCNCWPDHDCCFCGLNADEQPIDHSGSDIYEGTDSLRIKNSADNLINEMLSK